MSDYSGTNLVSSTNEICKMVQSTLGPFGASKLIVQDDGAVTTSTTGSTVLNHLDIEDPAVALLQQVASDMDGQHKNGTTQVMLLTGALLENAEELLNKGLHPTNIERGYSSALSTSVRVLDAGAMPLAEFGIDSVAQTALSSIWDPQLRSQIASLVKQVADTLIEEHGKKAFEYDRVGVTTRTGATRIETELLRGVVIDKKPVIEGMTYASVDSGIAIISSTVDLETIGSSTDRTSDVILKIAPDSFEEEVEIGERERELFQAQLSSAINAGCRVIFTSRSVNDRVKRNLANNEILAFQRVEDDDIDRIARLTGAQVVPKMSFIDQDTLGQGSVSVERKAGKDMAIVTSDSGEQIYTVFGRAPDPRMTKSFESGLRSALGAVSSAARNGQVVAGGGAIEVAAARQVMQSADSTGSRAQLAEKQFSQALMTVPRILAQNAGLDPIDTTTRLHTAHANGKHTDGVDVFESTTRDMTADTPTVEPLEIKEAVWQTATNLTIKLLRIDSRLNVGSLGE